MESSASFSRIWRVRWTEGGGNVHSGLEQTKAFIAALANLKLIEPIDISLRFDDGERLALQGLYTVSLDRLRDLDDAAAIGLFRAGHLQLAYIMTASLKQIGRLAHIRNRRARKSSDQK